MSEETANIIRFVDSSYKTLFYLPDGENIVITRPDGEQAVRPCAFLDEYHVRVGHEIFHICQFAECMERAGNTYAPEKPPKLPDVCASILPQTGELILIEKGKGFQKHGFSTGNPLRNRQEAERFNAYRKVTPQMEAAMLGGALKGWRTSAARPTSYDIHGNPVKPKRTRRKARGTER